MLKFLYVDYCLTKITIIMIIVHVYVCAMSSNKQCICKFWLRISCYFYFYLKEYMRLLKTRKMVMIQLLLAKLSQFSRLIE